MTSITTNTLRRPTFQTLHRRLAKLWTPMKPAHPTEPAHPYDPRIAQGRRDRARADVDHLLLRAH